MNNCTLIIDGNWLLQSRLSVRIDNFDKTNTPEQLEAASDDLLDLLAQSVNKIINFFSGNIDNIIMVQDGGSWRKHYPKPKLYTDVYKGNRGADDTKDWSYIWKSLNKFCQKFQENGITCTQARSIEGDDWCWFWSRYCNSHNCNAIIWSSDCDLKQLVQRDENTMRWTAWFNDRAGLVLPKCYDNSDLSEIDSFFTFDTKDPQVTSLVDNVYRRGHSVSYIDPESICLGKIICGDAGDNIKALVRVNNGKRNLRVSEKEWNRVAESTGVNSLVSLNEHKEEVIDELLHLKRFTSCTDSMEDLEEMLEYNYHMVVLSDKYIPQEQLDIMSAQEGEYKECDMDYIRNNYKVLGADDKRESDIDSLISELPF